MRAFRQVASARAGRRRGVRARRAGMTLIEVLAATAILAIGLVGVSAMVTYSVIAHDKAACYTIASDRAIAEIERIRDAGYNGAAVNTTLFPTDDYAILNTTQASFTCSDLRSGRGLITVDLDAAAQAINPNTGQPWSNLKRIDAQIWWRGQHGAEQTLEISAMLANRPK
jgi:prepilin-type N-terminal cleavage/methylation domain-containing protein